MQKTAKKIVAAELLGFLGFFLIFVFDNDFPEMISQAGAGRAVLAVAVIAGTFMLLVNALVVLYIAAKFLFCLLVERLFRLFGKDINL